MGHTQVGGREEQIPLLQMLTWRESTTPRETKGNSRNLHVRACKQFRMWGTRGNTGYSERVADIWDMEKNAGPA